MRTDAKIGFAIGGVLLAVLTVYAIVVPKHKKTSNNTVSLVTPVASSSAPDTSSATPPQMGASDSLTNSAGPSAPVAPPVTSKDSPRDSTPPANLTGPLADNNTGPVTPGMLQDPKNFGKPDGERPGKLQGDVYLPEGSKPRAPHKLPTAPPDDTDPAPASDRTYTIKSGQTLSKIAYEVYGNSRYWVAIQRENRGLDPNRLKVGGKINLPDISPIQPGPIAMAETPVSEETPIRAAVHQAPDAPLDAHSYVVKSGDSLYGIARRLLGSGHNSDALYALNKTVIGPDKARLKLGMVLKLPEATRTALAN